MWKKCLTGWDCPKIVRFFLVSAIVNLFSHIVLKWLWADDDGTWPNKAKIVMRNEDHPHFVDKNCLNWVQSIQCMNGKICKFLCLLLWSFDEIWYMLRQRAGYHFSITSESPDAFQNVNWVNHNNFGTFMEFIDGSTYSPLRKWWILDSIGSINRTALERWQLLLFSLRLMLSTFIINFMIKYCTIHFLQTYNKSLLMYASNRTETLSTI